MTDAQWMFEFHALRTREKEERDERVEIFKAQQQMLVSLLGLNTFTQHEEEIVPLALMCGTPEILAKLQEESQHESKALDAVDDPEFDEWSEKLAKGDLDDTDLWPAAEEPLVEFTRSPKLVFDED